MADTFKLSGSYTSAPTYGNPSGCPSVEAPIDEAMTLKKSPLVSEYELTADAPQAVSFGSLTNAHVVIIKTYGGKVRATLTSADGASQAIPVDSFAAIMSSSVPYTALSITRVSGTTTSVKVLLGEKA